MTTHIPNCINGKPCYFDNNIGECLESKNLPNLNGTKPYPQTQNCINYSHKGNDLESMNKDLSEAFKKQAIISRHYQFCPCDTLETLKSIENKDLNSCTDNSVQYGPKGPIPPTELCDVGMFNNPNPSYKDGIINKDACL